MKWKIIVNMFSMKVKEGMVVPRYYGRGYTDYYRDIHHFYIIPINFIVRFFVWLDWKWARIRFGGIKYRSAEHNYQYWKQYWKNYYGRGI